MTNVKITQLESELLLTWFRAEMTPDQHERLKRDMPHAYAALVDNLLVTLNGVSANINAEPRRRPSARRIR